MTKDNLTGIIEKLTKICGKLKIGMVLMGGIAVNVYARPRTTYDVDAVVSVSDEKMKKFLEDLAENGFKYDRKNPVKYIQGSPFITLTYSGTYVDLFLAEKNFQEEAIRRARKIKLNKTIITIISPEDLILTKLIAGRERDIDDVREILLENRKKIDFKYLHEWAKKLKVDIFLKDELKSLRISE